MVYPALLPLMRTPRLPVVNWTDAPADLNGLVRFAERRNLVSASLPSHFNWLLFQCQNQTQYFGAMLIQRNATKCLTGGLDVGTELHVKLFHISTNYSDRILQQAVYLCIKIFHYFKCKVDFSVCTRPRDGDCWKHIYQYLHLLLVQVERQMKEVSRI